MSKFYEINDDGTLVRKNRFCPRCGPGTFMADMYNRFVCGMCGFTEFKKKPDKKREVTEKKEKPSKAVKPSKSSKPAKKRKKK